MFLFLIRFLLTSGSEAPRCLRTTYMYDLNQTEGEKIWFMLNIQSSEIFPVLLNHYLFDCMLCFHFIY